MRFLRYLKDELGPPHLLRCPPFGSGSRGIPRHSENFLVGCGGRISLKQPALHSVSEGVSHAHNMFHIAGGGATECRALCRAFNAPGGDCGLRLGSQLGGRIFLLLFVCSLFVFCCDPPVPLSGGLVFPWSPGPPIPCSRDNPFKALLIPFQTHHATMLFANGASPLTPRSFTERSLKPTTHAKHILKHTSIKCCKCGRANWLQRMPRHQWTQACL